MLRYLTSARIGWWVLILAVAGCSHGPTATSVQPLEAYPFHQATGGIKVAVDPLFTKERARTEFPGGDAFEEQGLLPIQVMIENGSRQPIRAEREGFRLIRATGQSEAALSVQDAFSLVKPPVGWWAALPILGPSASAVRNSDWYKQFESRALKDTAIPAEGSAAGLVYFFFPESDKDLAGARVVFVLRAESGEERSFDIALQGRRDIPGQGARPVPSTPVNRPSKAPQVPTRVEGQGGAVIIRSPAP